MGEGDNTMIFQDVHIFRDSGDGVSSLFIHSKTLCSFVIDFFRNPVHPFLCYLWIGCKVVQVFLSEPPKHFSHSACDEPGIPCAAVTSACVTLHIFQINNLRDLTSYLFPSWSRRLGCCAFVRWWRGCRSGLGGFV